MSSDKQIEANRLNAQRSTGPRTPAGKGRVSLNALKHGLTGRDVVLPNENPDDFESFRADLLSSLNPQGALEGVLAEKIVAEAWRLRRVPIFEATLHRRGCKELLVKPAAESVKQCEKDFARAQAELDDPSFNVTRVLEMFPEPFSNLWRHESTLNRAAFRTLHEFQRLQAARAGEHVPAPAMMDMDISVSGSPPLDVEGNDETD
jgi:hypothetical protein